jgi:putative RecB family exonuclease
MITAMKSLSARAVRTPKQEAELLTGRPYLTYSEIKTFQTCPLRWHYQYVEKAKPEQLSSAMLLGSSVHAAVQMFFQSKLSAEQPPSIEQMMEAYRANWQRESDGIPIQYGKGQTVQSLEATARRMLERFLASIYAQPKEEIIGIEESFKVHLADDLPDLAGRVDMVTYANGELIVTDYKTARSMWAEETAEDHGEQLVLYSQGMEPIARELKATIRVQFVIITKAKEPKLEAREVTINADRFDRSRAITRQIFKAMCRGTIYPNPSPMNCSGCSFQNRCAGWHRKTG